MLSSKKKQALAIITVFLLTKEKAIMKSPISDYLADYQRANLIQIPVIIHKLHRLSLLLKQEIYILRDDLTGFALGGNKTRKLDFLIGDAINKKSSSLVTMKATSFSRNAAAGAAACGLNMHVILPGKEADQNTFSQSVFKKWGAKLHYVKSNNLSLENHLKLVVSSLRDKGEIVYIMHPGGSDRIGALSYVAVLDEINKYSEQNGVHFSHIFHSTSSAGTQAGLTVGQCIAEYETKVIGISVERTVSQQTDIVNKLAQSMAYMIGSQFDSSKIIVDDNYIGPNYAIASREGQLASQMFAEVEGILLDPVYTGKAAAALINYVKNEHFKCDSVLFIHTGGNAGLYY